MKPGGWAEALTVAILASVIGASLITFIVYFVALAIH